MSVNELVNNIDTSPLQGKRCIEMALVIFQFHCEDFYHQDGFYPFLLQKLVDQESTQTASQMHRPPPPPVTLPVDSFLLKLFLSA